MLEINIKEQGEGIKNRMQKWRRTIKKKQMSLKVIIIRIEW